MTSLTRTSAGRLVALLAGAALASVLGARVAGAQDSGERVLRGDCTACHTRAHDLVLGKGESASQKCVTCHDKVHPEQKAMEAFYGGAARPGTVHPDPMFKARVDCADCHLDKQIAVKDAAARTAALDRVCTNCHGTRFGGMLTRWSAGMQWRTDAVNAYIAQAAQDTRSAARARGRIDDARDDIALITGGVALHNVRGADALLRDALDNAGAAYRAAGMNAPEKPRLGPNAANVSCVGCHYGVEAARDSAFGRPFDHAAHIIRADVACTRCHSDADFLIDNKNEPDLRKRQVDPRHGKTTLTAASCNSCHHDPASTVACTSCHRTDATARGIQVTLPLRLTPKNAPRSRAVTFLHTDHPRLECASCHTSREAPRQVAQCSSCHETHHAEAKECVKCHAVDTRAAHKQQDHFACTSCHATTTVAMLTPTRAFCVNCHAAQAGHKPDRECTSCHMQSTPADVRKRILGGGH